MGAETTMVGKLGNDDIASITRAHMEGMGIRTDFVGSTPDAASGVATITCSSDGQNVIIIVPGANHLREAPTFTARAPAGHSPADLAVFLQSPTLFVTGGFPSFWPGHLI